MSLFNHKDFDGHQEVVFCADKASGLRAIVAIHNTNRGPAMGGCRMWPYPSDDAALEDVLRLSRGMTYKAAMARGKLHRIADTLAEAFARSDQEDIPANLVADRMAEERFRTGGGRDEQPEARASRPATA